MQRSLVLRSFEKSLAAFIAMLAFAAHFTFGQEKRPDVSEFAVKCEAAKLGESVRGYLELIEYKPGDAPLILAAPHGGRKSPGDFMARKEGVLVEDTNTDRLARGIADAFEQITGGRPHLVVCELQRRFMDANRPLEAACAADSPAITTWHEYQQSILAAKKRVSDASGRGLFIEIHGHGHPQQRLELGYLLRARDFEISRADLDALKKRTSIREISERRQLDLEELLRGDELSLGGLLENEGLASVPGPKIQGPGDDPYFNGGWNTMTHGSRDSGTISSIQIECHRVGIRDSEENVLRSAKQIAAAIKKFLEAHYAYRPKPGK